MSRWSLVLREGKNLREEIVNGASGNILRSIKICLDEIKEKFPNYENNEYLWADVENLDGLIEGEADLCDSDDCSVLDDWGVKDFEELVNCRLTELYNLADANNIFISL